MLKRFKHFTFCGFILFACLLLHCSNDLQPTAFDSTDYPDPPTRLKVSIGDQKIILTWNHANAAQIDYYKIYRQSGLDTALAFIDSTSQLSYTDNDVNNSIVYNYAVSAVQDSLEGLKSASTVARPTSYGLVINGGAEFTSNRNVTLLLSAPENTGFMQISNDSSFTAAQWQPFQQTIVWMLTTGDGVKTVYVKYQDPGGGESFDPASSTITLDTRAGITSVTENTDGQTRQAGQSIHFTLNAGEPFGTATVDIGTARTAIPLFDDGTGGDAVADDGIYETDYQIDSDVEVTAVRITGRFTDAAGNVAVPVESQTAVTINNPPGAVTLLAPQRIQNSRTSLLLSWTRSAASDFAGYRLYRSGTPGVDQNATLIASLDNINSLSFTDEGLKENTTYYYAIYVLDNKGVATASNEVSGSTAQNDAPAAVNLLAVENTDGSISELRLSWTQNTDSDFSAYKIYRSLTPGVTETSTLVTSLNNQATLTYTDSGLEKNTIYYYKVYVVDNGGLSSGSNELSGATSADEPPAAVTLFKPDVQQSAPRTLLLSWTQNNDDDFASYRLYRGTASGVTSANGTFVTTVTSRTGLSYSDSDLEESTTYYYVISVFDAAGNMTASNEVSATTLSDEPPAAVTLLNPDVQQSAPRTLLLSWTQNNDDDFASYRLYRGTASGVTSANGAFVTTVTSRASLSYSDSDLEENTTYFYVLYVLDRAGNMTASNEVSGTTLSDEPPDPVTLTQPIANSDSTAFSLSWSRSFADDFESYRIYRSTTSPVDTTAAPLVIISSSGSTSYNDSNVQKGNTYFYRVFVFDRQGLSAGSNEVVGSL